MPPYTYTWTYEGDPIPNTNDASDLTGLEPGQYTVTVTDANNCPEEIFTVTLVEPEEMTIAVTNEDYNNYGTSCYDANDGVIIASVVGGTEGEYIYTWTYQDNTITEW